MRPLFRPLLASALLTATALAAPISSKELDLLVRMRTSEREILEQVSTRRLVAPIDPATEKLLLSNGASAALLQQLKAGNFVAAPGEIPLAQRAAEDKALLDRERASDRAAFDAAERNRRAPATISNTMRSLFEGKLVRLQGDDLRPYSTDEMRGIRCYALYYSAHWCAPCRKFTPELVSFYQRFKAQHPDFEVIFISHDRNAAAMQAYMKEVGMPWPAVQFEKIDDKLRSFEGSGIPWLGLYSDAGVAISNNGNTKEWADPAGILAAFEQAVAKGGQP